jgi:glutamate--cysteine ligase
MLAEGGRERSLRERGLTLADGVREVAELLDGDAQGYVAAVDAAAEALRDPERTPSARLLHALRVERASFFEYTLELARSHAAYFLDFELSSAREEALGETARRSLADAEAAAGQDPRPFAQYLRDYFART